MTNKIDSEDDLPDDIRSHVSSTFDFPLIQNLLTTTYYKGPIPEGEGGRGGYGLRHRGHALMGMPSTHRKSVLRKAKDVELITEFPEGYVTTPRGADLLQQMAICDDCGEREVPAEIPIGRKRQGSIYVDFRTTCPSCTEFEEREDDSLRYGKFYRFNSDEERFETAVNAMEKEGVEVWLNGMSLEDAKDELNG